MPHYVPNEYPNIFECRIFTERISEYIRTPEIAQIQIIFQGHFIRIFEYSNIHAHHWTDTHIDIATSSDFSENQNKYHGQSSNQQQNAPNMCKNP